MIFWHHTQHLFLLFGLVSLLWGCNPSTDSPPKPDVARKKIVMPAQQLQKQNKPVSQKKEEKKSKDNNTDKKITAAISKETKKLIPEDEFPPLYKSEGKLDPFVPLIRSKTAVQGARKKKVKKRIPRTPLEKMDLSQIKLVAVILAPKGNKALVEEANGKGYIISKGTYIGLHAGRVVMILKDRLVIEEETEDVLGKSVIRKRELKLQKPPGEF